MNDLKTQQGEGMEFNFGETLQELDGGVFLAKVSRAVAEAALGVAENGEKGKVAKVVIELTLERIGESRQVQMKHKLAYTRPTRRGKASEEDTTATPLFVGKRGVLSIAPENQLDAFKV